MRENSIKFKDKSTVFYHAMASGRKRRNRILLLWVNGRDIKGPRAIKNAIRRFLKNLCSQPNVPIISLPDDILPKISVEEVEILERKPSIDEVKEAVWSCDSSKSPVYDGFNFTFIKNLWDSIGDDIIGFVLNFLRLEIFQKKLI